jgi:hypothetical protein
MGIGISGYNRSLSLRAVKGLKINQTQEDLIYKLGVL